MNIFLSDFANLNMINGILGHAVHNGQVKLELEQALRLEMVWKLIKMNSRPKIK